MTYHEAHEGHEENRESQFTIDNMQFTIAGFLAAEHREDSERSGELGYKRPSITGFEGGPIINFVPVVGGGKDGEKGG